MSWGEVGGATEVEIVAVDEDFEGLWRGIGGRGADEDAVEFYLARKAI